MKRIILIALIVIPGIVHAQSKSEYTYFDLSDENTKFDSTLENYVQYCHRKIKRNRALDSICERRGNYYLNLLKDNASSDYWISELVDKIPEGSEAHERLFGTPKYFKETKAKYQENLVYVPSVRKKICCEIMVHLYSRKILDKRIPGEEMKKIAIEGLSNKYTRAYILSLYQNSEGHNDGILRYGKGDYGSYTTGMLHEWYWKKKKKWVYEFIIYNSVSFSRDPQ